MRASPRARRRRRASTQDAEIRSIPTLHIVPRALLPQPRLPLSAYARTCSVLGGKYSKDQQTRCSSWARCSLWMIFILAAQSRKGEMGVGRGERRGEREERRERREGRGEEREKERRGGGGERLGCVVQSASAPQPQTAGHVATPLPAALTLAVRTSPSFSPSLSPSLSPS